MKQRSIAGVSVSAIGLGCNNFGYVANMDVAASRKVIDKAIHSGITFFDTSDSYGTSEDILGEVLGERRKNIVLATKFGDPFVKTELVLRNPGRLPGVEAWSAVVPPDSPCPLPMLQAHLATMGAG